MRRERGSMAIVMVAVVGLVAVLAVAVTGLAGLYAVRAQSQTAADAAALAAAVATYPPLSSDPPRLAARGAAAANGAVVISCSCPTDPSLQVRTVEVRTAMVTAIPIFGRFTVRASSRAEFDPIRWLGG